jgi:general secretion pathway protein G
VGEETREGLHSGRVFASDAMDSSISRHRHRRPAVDRCKTPPGFTLLELMVVIMIIGLLAALVVPRYFDTVGKSKAKIARAQMDSLEKALEQYRLDIGAFPSVEQGLGALTVAPAGIKKWQGPYLKKAVPSDPWGHDYLYKITSTGDVDLISLGSDGQPGGTGEAKDIALSSPD